MAGWCVEDLGRASWDPMALIYAVRGPYAFYSLVAGEHSVNPTSGWVTWTPRYNAYVNEWTNGPPRNHDWREQARVHIGMWHPLLLLLLLLTQRAIPCP